MFSSSIQGRYKFLSLTSKHRKCVFLEETMLLLGSFRQSPGCGHAWVFLMDNPSLHEERGPQCLVALLAMTHHDTSWLR